MLERKDTARKNILMLMALSGGVMKKSICEEICGSKAYYGVVMKRMKDAGEAETIFGQKPKTLHIKRKGVEVIAKNIPWIMDLYEKRLLTFNKTKNQRLSDISQIIYNMQLIGVDYYPLEKRCLFREKTEKSIDCSGKMAYYTPMEVKQLEMDELRGSRLCGLLVGGGCSYILYNMEDHNIKFNKKTEMNASMAIHKYCVPLNACKNVVFGNGFGMCEKILQNGEIEMSRAFQQKTENYNFLTPEPDFYYIPNGKSGSIYLKALLRPEHIRDIETGIKDREAMEIVNLLPIHLPTLVHIKRSSGNLAVLCLDGQKEFVKSLNERVKIFTVPEKDLLAYLG